MLEQYPGRYYYFSVDASQAAAIAHGKGDAPLRPPSYPLTDHSRLTSLTSRRRDQPAHTGIRLGFLHPDCYIRCPADSRFLMQIRDGQNPKNGQGDGPLRLPASVAVRSSSPTTPGQQLRTHQAPPNPQAVSG